MSVLDQISSDLELFLAKRQRIQEALETQKHHSSSLTLQWQDLEQLCLRIQSSFETRFKQLECGERQSKKSLDDIMIDQFRSVIRADRKRLFIFVQEIDKDDEKSVNEVYNALKAAENPAKLVLDAIKMGVLKENVDAGKAKKSCLVLLEQLIKIKPEIETRLRKQGAKVARKWKKKMMLQREEDNVVVLVFLMLVGAYKLDGEFESNEIRSLLEVVGQHKHTPELRRLLGFSDKPAPVGCAVDYNVKLQQPPLENLHLDFSKVKFEQHIAFSSISPWSELRSYCINMDAMGLRSFLCQHVAEHESMRRETSDALRLALDPAKLVLDALPGFYCSKPGDFVKGSVALCKVRSSCILLLEQLWTISPRIEPQVSEEALKLAVDWKPRLERKHMTSSMAYGFLKFIVTYGLVSSFDAHELLCFLVTASEYKQSPDLCLALGFADKIPTFVDNLVRNNLRLEAITYICAFELFKEFPPARILKSHLSYSKKMISQKARKAHSQQLQDQYVDKEIAGVRSVIKCIHENKLELECPPQDLKEYILQLEQQKADGSYTAHGKKALKTIFSKPQQVPEHSLKYANMADASVSDSSTNRPMPSRQMEGLLAHQATPYSSSAEYSIFEPFMGSFSGAYGEKGSNSISPSDAWHSPSGVPANGLKEPSIANGAHLGRTYMGSNWDWPLD